MDSSHETRLIHAAQRGDQQAIADLYRLHVQAVYRYIYARINQPALAEDITSDVFLRAIETLPGYEQQGVPFLGWLYRIAHGRVVDHYRRSARRAGDQTFDEMQLASDDDLESGLLEQDQQAQLLEHLQQLTDEQQQVLSMRFVQGHNLETTAQLMGKTEGAIKGLQFRALRALATLFKAEDHANG